MFTDDNLGAGEREREESMSKIASKYTVVCCRFVKFLVVCYIHVCISMYIRSFYMYRYLCNSTWRMKCAWYINVQPSQFSRLVSCTVNLYVFVLIL